MRIPRWVVTCNARLAVSSPTFQIRDKFSGVTFVCLSLVMVAATVPVSVPVGVPARTVDEYNAANARVLYTGEIVASIRSGSDAKISRWETTQGFRFVAYTLTERVGISTSFGFHRGPDMKTGGSVSNSRVVGDRDSKYRLVPWEWNGM